jgi:O-antigen/teichoic acid export membrane protein
MFDFQSITNKLKGSRLFKDSFWAVFGNGTGNFLLLLAGIIIARLLGKDLYGEYGLVKTTMFHIAAFSTFGLGYTSTKFVAQYMSEDVCKVYSYIKSAFKITLVSSITLCILLFLFSEALAQFVNEPRLSTAFRLLGLIMIFRALSTTGSGILAGLKRFKSLGINNIISGVSMLILGAIFTYLWGLKGSLLALLVSQAIIAVLNLLIIYRSDFKNNEDKSNTTIELLRFSFPVAMQELTYTLSHWLGPLILARYASIGEVGIYSAAAQWNAIVLFIPGLLSNVVLSYLSGVSKENEMHNRIVYRMILVNFICSFIPFCVVFTLSGLIASFYGESFVGLQSVLNILVFSTIFICLSNVLQSNMISEGRNWLLFIIRSGRDFLLLFLIYFIISSITEGGARYYAYISVFISGLYFFILYIIFLLDKKSL